MVPPRGLNDRQEDGVEPLLAIADAAGGDWPQKARKALSDLYGAEIEDDDYRTQVLVDIKSVFDQTGVKIIASGNLAEKLRAIEDSPWPTWGKTGKGITSHGLKKLLSGFEVRPDNHWDGETCIRGYARRDFESAFMA